MEEARKGQRRELTLWWQLGVLLLGPMLRIAFRLRFLRVDRIPERCPAILAANHMSYLDGVLLAYAPASERRRVIRFLVAAEFFENRWLGWFLRRFHQIPIRRGAKDVAALDETLATIRAGALAGVFPEGHINEGRELQRGRTGVARIALAAACPVVPVGIWGTQARWPKRGLNLRRPLRTPITLAFGEPIRPVGDVDSPEDIQAFTRLVMDGIAEQVAEARANVERR